MIFQVSLRFEQSVGENRSSHRLITTVSETLVDTISTMHIVNSHCKEVE